MKMQHPDFKMRYKIMYQIRWQRNYKAVSNKNVDKGYAYLSQFVGLLKYSRLHRCNASFCLHYCCCCVVNYACSRIPNIQFVTVFYLRRQNCRKCKIIFILLLVYV